jgi:hypothetical protein
MDKLQPRMQTLEPICRNSLNGDYLLFEQAQLQQKLLNHAEKIVSNKFERKRVKEM